MTHWTLPFALFGLLVATGTSFAADKVVTRFETQKTDNGTTSFVGFAYASCEEECQIATLTCSESGAISLVVADVDAKNAAAAITQSDKQIALNVGAKSFDYHIYEMDFMELTGSWWLTASTQDVNAQDLAPAIAAAKIVEAQVGGSTVALEVDANVKAWALACK